MIDRSSDNYRNLPLWLKYWFFLNLFSFRPQRNVCKRIEIVSHLTGFLFCCLGFISEAASAGGLFMLANAYLFYLHTWLGDRYGVWYLGQTETIASNA